MPPTLDLAAGRCSRAAAIRSIVSADIRRQGPVAANAAVGG